MAKRITVYECEYGCGRYLKTKKCIENHEKRCFFNPVMKACATCGNNVVGELTVYNPVHYGDPGSTDYVEEYPYCQVKDLNLLRKGNPTCDCSDWIPRENNNKGDGDK